MVQAEGLTKLVEHNNKKVAEKQLEGLKTELTEMITQDPPTPVDECLAAIKAKKAEFSLADSELVKVSSYIKTCCQNCLVSFTHWPVRTYVGCASCISFFGQCR